MKTLTILIPTYNRCNDLLYNLGLLENFIIKGGWEDVITILISNNCSTDDTASKLNDFKKQSHARIVIYQQEKNIGLEKNALFCLEKATGDFIMYLGDDDYISLEYLEGVMKAISSIDKLSCIVPSWIGITPDKKIKKDSYRDIYLKTKLYEPGFESSLENSYRGHQLSGLTFLRDGLYDEYISKGVSNIYPFIFMVAFTSLHGKLLHLTEYPIKITQPNQDKKDWGYKEDGLISEIFDNYKKLGVTSIQRARYEFRIIRKQPFRYSMYFRNGTRSGLKAMRKIVLGKNTSFIGSVCIFSYFLYYLLKK